MFPATPMPGPIDVVLECALRNPHKQIQPSLKVLCVQRASYEKNGESNGEAGERWGKFLWGSQYSIHGLVTPCIECAYRRSIAFRVVLSAN